LHIENTLNCEKILKLSLSRPILDQQKNIFRPFISMLLWTGRNEQKHETVSVKGGGVGGGRGDFLGGGRNGDGRGACLISRLMDSHEA
jgi:hypothetical protein